MTHSVQDLITDPENEINNIIEDDLESLFMADLDESRIVDVGPLKKRQRMMEMPYPTGKWDLKNTLQVIKYFKS